MKLFCDLDLKTHKHEFDRSPVESFWAIFTWDAGFVPEWNEVISLGFIAFVIVDLLDLE